MAKEVRIVVTLGKGHEGAFLGAGNILHVDLDGVTWVHTCAKIHWPCMLKICAL